MMKYIIDPGHGGMAFGHYFTPGKRWQGLYEGEFNRDVAQYLCRMSDRYLNIAPGPIRIPLTPRIKFINKLAAVEDCTVISIHANAVDTKGEKWAQANGHRIFTCKNPSSKSNLLASIIDENFKNTISSYGQVKRKNFDIVYKTKCPAVLAECAFMTNDEDNAKLKTSNFRMDCASVIHSSILQYELQL